MGVKSVKLKPGSRRGPVEHGDGSVSYHETYIVETTSVSIRGGVVVGDGRVPKLGTAYRDDVTAICDLIDPQQQEVGEVWHVAVTWLRPSPNKPQQGTPPGGESSTLPQRDWTSVTYAEYPLKDLDGKPFRNAAGDPFDPAVAILRRNRVLTITIPGIESFDADQANGYLGAINSDVFTVDGLDYPKFGGLITTFDGSLSYLADETPTWNVVVQIEFNWDLWHPHKVLNRGPRYLEAIPYAAGATLSEMRAVLARDGNEVLFNGSVLLKLDGTLLPKDDDNVTWIEFKVYKQKNFAALNLPLG